MTIGVSLYAAASPDVVSWKPSGISSQSIRIARRLRPGNGTCTSSAARRSSPAGESWSVAAGSGMVRGPAAGLRGRRRRSRSVVHARWTQPLFHLHALTGRRQAQGSRHLADGSRRRRRVGAPAHLPEPVNSPGPSGSRECRRTAGSTSVPTARAASAATDIWRARRDRTSGGRRESGADVNTASDEYEPQPSPDGSPII